MATEGDLETNYLKFLNGGSDSLVIASSASLLNFSGFGASDVSFLGVNDLTVSGSININEINQQNISRPTIGSNSSLWTIGTGPINLASSSDIISIGSSGAGSGTINIGSSNTSSILNIGLGTSSILTIASAGTIMNLGSSENTGAFTADIASSDLVQSGIIWTPTSLSFAGTWTSVCYAENINTYVALNSGGALTNQVATSNDGINWTLRTIPDIHLWTSVCWSPELNLFAAVSTNTSRTTQFMTSPDGITWTNRAAPNPSRQWVSVTWSPFLRLFCAVANNGNAGQQACTSPNGTTWSFVSSIAGTQVWTSVCWASDINIFCAVSSDFNIMTSNSGTTWTSQTVAATSAWQSVCYSSPLTLLCAVANNSIITNQVMTSPNGINWTARSSAAVHPWESVCWSNYFGIFIAVATNGAIMYSSDGINWFLYTTSLTIPWLSVCASNNLSNFVTVGTGITGTYSNTNSFFNKILTIGSTGSSSVRIQGSNVVLYNKPYYYSETNVARNWNNTTRVTDIIIYNVPAGIYMVSIWFLNLLKSGIAGTSEQLTLLGGASILYSTLIIPLVDNTGAAAATTGPKYFKFVINNPINQNISYALAASGTATGGMFTAGFARTMYLKRIG